jgi:hypothetical protein
VGIARSSLVRVTVSYKMSHISAMEAGPFCFREARRCSVCGGLVSLGKASIVRGSGSGQIHQDGNVIVGRTWGVSGIVRLLSWVLLWVLLVGALVPTALLEIVSELLE